jgi:hypothetical protein
MYRNNGFGCLCEKKIGGMPWGMRKGSGWENIKRKGPEIRAGALIPGCHHQSHTLPLTLQFAQEFARPSL